MKVLIVGAGVAGLSCAVALRRAGIDELTVVERGTDVAAQGGTGIAIPPNGARALAAIGVAVDSLIREGSRLRQYRLLDPQGRRVGQADLTRLWLSDELPYFAVHRRDVYRSLLKALADQPIEFRSSAVLGPGALTDDGPVPMHVTGPAGSRREAFDVVVGADGIHSSIREAVRPGLAPRPLGWWAWRCVVRHEGIDPEVQVVHSGAGGVFLYLPIGGDRVYVYAACRQVDGQGTRHGHGAALRARFAGFALPPGLVQAVEGLSDAAFHAGPLEEVPYEHLACAGKGRVVLVGDALHACSPNMAQGVSLAAEDGAVLAELLADDPRSVAERFWRRRLPRIRHVQELTRRRDHLLARRTESALFRKVSDLVIRLRGADRLQHQAFRYLLDHRP